jgi:dienelactone hydrolase
MDRATIQRDVTYKTDGGAQLKMDVYHPANVSKDARLPVVIFVNGVGDPQPPTLKLKEWGQYTTWPRLVAATGLAAITYESRSASTAADAEDLIKHVRANAAALKVDANRICLWSCSANVRVGLPMALEANRDYLRCAVIYYGGASAHPTARTLPLLVARAGQDIPNINAGIDTFVREALAADAPITLINYVDGQHAFDLRDDNDQTREVIKQTLDFMKFHLTRPDAAAARQLAPTPNQFTTMVKSQGVEKALEAFAEAKKKNPEAVLFRENTVNAVGYQLLGERKAKDAIEVFKLNVASFPQSANVYDSLADAYEADGNRALAIEYSEKALEALSKDTNTPEPVKQNIRQSAEEKLRRLKGQ